MCFHDPVLSLVSCFLLFQRTYALVSMFFLVPFHKQRQRRRFAQLHCPLNPWAQPRSLLWMGRSRPAAQPLCSSPAAPPPSAPSSSQHLSREHLRQHTGAHCPPHAAFTAVSSLPLLLAGTPTTCWTRWPSASCSSGSTSRPTASGTRCCTATGTSAGEGQGPAGRDGLGGRGLLLSYGLYQTSIHTVGGA